MSVTSMLLKLAEVARKLGSTELRDSLRGVPREKSSERA